jgi:UDP-N-acetylglucosamine--N-acetylmuramyl-(pentapeptide) pyrophosphoryl-undecaprenol N-acetylglucosamine transferase
MKIVLIGGHLAPALSVLEALPKETQMLFIGRKYSLEGDDALSLEFKKIISLGVPFVGLNTGRLQRRVTKYTILSLFKLPAGVVKSFLILLDFKPDVVVGFGGYVSIPVAFCAYLLGIPVVIHEQTLEAGLSNRIVSRFAKKICISWDSSRPYFPKDKIVLTGNPMRKFSILDTEYKLFRNNLPIIYVTGGSSGSHAINVLIEGILEKLLASYNVIHQAGDAQEYRDFDRLNALRKTLPEELRDNYILEKLIDPSEVGDLLNHCSLVISRSGINTVTELIHFKKPALLIPLPFSQHNEQLRNAQFLQKIGLAVVLRQTELNEGKLLIAVNKMFGKIDTYKIDEKNCGNLPGKNAAQNIISVINYVYKSKVAKTS